MGDSLLHRLPDQDPDGHDEDDPPQRVSETLRRQASRHRHPEGHPDAREPRDPEELAPREGVVAEVADWVGGAYIRCTIRSALISKIL